MKTKMCGKCKRQRKIKHFTKNRSRKDGLNSSCRDCHKEYQHKHYRENRKYYTDKAKRERARIDEAINEAKQKPCADCNQSYPFYVMDFDHKRGKKLFNVSSRRSGIKGVLKEIEKCDVVCANCHRERTYGTIARLAQ